MANRFKAIRVSPVRIVVIVTLAVIVCILLILRDELQPTRQAMPQSTPSIAPAVLIPACIYDNTIPVTSPECPPHVMLSSGQPMLTGTLPNSGVCSIEEAANNPVIAVDFTRYIGEDAFISEMIWRANGQGGMTVALPIAAYDVLKILSPAIPNDEQLTYAISPESYESLEEALPSLGTTLKNMGIRTKNHYLTSHRCLPLYPTSK